MKKQEQSKKLVIELDETRRSLSQIETDLIIMEAQAKNNKTLQKYIELVKAKTEKEKTVKDLKDNIYETMLQEKEDKLTIGNTSVTLVKPFTKLKVETDKFIADYGPKSKEYKKYVVEYETKGHINIKDNIK